MECKNSLFCAARDGNLRILITILLMKSRLEIRELISAHIDGVTPLIIACKNGHAAIVQYLLECYKCCANVDQVGTVTIENETIEGASPLWCAAALGHLSIVKLLIKHKASINSTTKTMSTPLRAACFDGHYEVVKYLIEHGADIEIGNRHGHTCLMIACYKGYDNICKYLLEKGADVSRKTDSGKTALHESVEGGNLEIIKMLLSYRAKMYDEDKWGVTPLLCAAIYGHSLLVEYFIQNYEFTNLQIVNALELLGATIVDKKPNLIEALNYWERAMMLRYYDNKLQLKEPSLNSPIGTEVQTLNELKDLISDPEEMRIQALLIRERILGPNHPETLYYLKTRAAISAGVRNFQLCIRLWKYALDVHQQNQEPLSVGTLSTLAGFSELFCSMMSDSLDENTIVLSVVSFEDILHVFKRAIFEIENVLKHPKLKELIVSDNYSRIITFALHLLSLMCLLRPKLNQSEEMTLVRAAYKYAHLNLKTPSGQTPLHLACYEYPTRLVNNFIFSTLETSSLFFSTLEVTRLLLEVGACPNVMDKSRNTPLHIAAKNKPFRVDIFKLLLEHGAHIDFRNLEHQTPLQLVSNTPLINICPLLHLNLQCLCAQVISIHKIPYKKKIPKQLCEFVDCH